MATKIKPPRTTVTGRAQAATGMEDFGELSANLADRKLFVRDAGGVPRLIAQGIATHSTALIYALGDLTIFDDKLYLCSTAVPVPGPFVPASWTLLGGGGSGDLAGAVILAPTTLARNKINTLDNPAASGLIIEGDPAQTADLLVVEGSSQSDPGRWAIDALGFPNARAGSVVWRQAEPTHAFVARGQPAAFNGTRWVPADADETWGTALALVQEILDANTLVLRADGRISNLQTTAFAGGTITPGTTYYTSATVPGQLTPVEPTEGRRDAVLVATSATAGVVTTGASRRLVEAPPPVTVGPTAPADPDLGDLWYRTTTPIGLRVWRDDISIGEWVVATEVPPQVISVGDVPPAAPLNGQLWFKTANPVGLFIWFTDVDSSQWVQVGGGSGAEVDVPLFATTAEARAGVVTDKIMSPALAQARSGILTVNAPIAVAGRTFTGIPAEATELDLMFDVLGSNATGAHNIDLVLNSIVTGYAIFRTALANSVPVAASDLPTTAIRCEVFASGLFAVGNVRLLRAPSGRWMVDGKWRSNPNQVSIVGSAPTTVGAISSLQLTPSVALAIGSAHLRWRI